MREALKTGSLEQKADEVGDLLFVIANLARMLGINPETALRDCNNKFERRFRGLETELKKSYENLNDASLEEMEAAWNKQKQKERAA